jgi:hypothetical protein
VIVRGTKILAAGALLPLGETTIHSERFGTRHRAALGTTEQTDAIVVVVSEENSQVSLVQRARIVRNLNESQMTRSLRQLLEPSTERARLRATVPGARAPRLADIGRAVRAGRRDRVPAEPIPPDEPLVPDQPESIADLATGDVSGAGATEAPAAPVAAQATGTADEPAPDEEPGPAPDSSAAAPDGDAAGATPTTVILTNGVPPKEREPAGTRGRSR